MIASPFREKTKVKVQVKTVLPIIMPHRDLLFSFLSDTVTCPTAIRSLPSMSRFYLLDSSHVNVDVKFNHAVSIGQSPLTQSTETLEITSDNVDTS